MKLPTAMNLISASFLFKFQCSCSLQRLKRSKGSFIAPRFLGMRDFTNVMLLSTVDANPSAWLVRQGPPKKFVGEGAPSRQHQHDFPRHDGRQERKTLQPLRKWRSEHQETEAQRVTFLWKQRQQQPESIPEFMSKWSFPIVLIFIQQLTQQEASQRPSRSAPQSTIPTSRPRAL